ncbi:MAG: M48 family metallopeptidase [Flammeovirgaceae bacterium]|nr:M48 family metallopeptidase [Flammeovirgaceae bacterium]
MEYVGLQGQINRNNFRSVLLLIAFPLIILAGVYFVILLSEPDPSLVNEEFIMALPVAIAGVGIWFLIAYFTNTKLIMMATKSHTLERKDNMRIYNLVENLCMSKGMQMPKVHVIESEALNAFASGINQKSYTVTLTRGIINTLTDEELEGVIAHELMHIRNKDVRLLIVSIIFVGILSFIVDIALRSVLYGGGGSRKKDKNSGGQLVLIILLVSVVAYILSLVFKFALSQKREYLADAGAAEMTRNPKALASALRKISGRADLGNVRGDVEQLFISNESKEFFGGGSGLFATHPPIDKRIKILEQF